MASSVRRRGKETGFYEDSTRDEAYEPFIPRTIRPKLHVVSLTLYTTYLICFGIVIFVVAAYFNDRMPSPNENKLHDFVAERAINDLKGLVEIGPKVTGSKENEVIAVEYIMKIISDISKTAAPVHKLEVDIQTVSGSFSIWSVGLHYNNVQNIIVRIGPRNNASVLVNCHYDTVPTSPGASDDGLNCAVMLEALRVISFSKNPLSYGVIFLFNGAEENPLMASHGFITQHKWAKEVKAFINLESCGAGGREILFQSGPNCTWVVDAYAEAAVHPSGNVIGEEIFQGGIIPSDTDFRIFRDHGHIPGLDFAHCRNGYVYHTTKDNLESIVNLPGVIQHTGDNLLSLIKIFAGNNSKIASLHSVPKQKSVYYDVLGLYFISYSEDTATLINSITVMLSLICVILLWHPTRKLWVFVDLARRSAALLLALVFAVHYNLFLAFILDYFSASMSWFTNSFVLVALYVIPTVVSLVFAMTATNSYLLEKRKPYLVEHTLAHFLPTQTFWTIILSVLTFLKIRSAFILLPFVLIPSVVFILLSLFYQENKLTARGIYFFSTCFSSVYIVYCGIQGLLLFLPITGRAGPTILPDIPIAALVTLITFCAFSYISSFPIDVKAGKLAKNLMIVHVGLSCALIFSNIGFPFSANTPQRILITDTTRNSTVSQESLLFIDLLERRGVSVLPKFASFPHVKSFCTDDVPHCGLPWTSPKTFMKRPPVPFLNSAEVSRWLPSTPHDHVHMTRLEVLSDEVTSENIRTISLQMFGPDRMTLLVHTKFNLISWSINDEIPSALYSSSTGNSYAIRHVHGLKTPSWNITFQFQMVDFDPSEVKKHIHIDFIGHHMHGPMSPNLERFISKLPSWVDVTPSLATLRAYKL